MRILLALVISFISAGSLLAEEEATLKGRFILKGSAPEPTQFDLGRDACCVEASPKDERWLVGSSGGLANVVVSLRVGRDESVSLPKLEEATKAPQTLTNKDCRFTPRVMLMRAGQTLRLANDDPTTHNVAATFGRNTSLNVVLAPEKAREFLMSKPERKPMPVSCNIHPYMKGYVFVSEHPFVAVTNTHGEFEICHLPIGEWQFQFWHEGKYLKECSFTLGGVDYQSDKRGRVRIPLITDGVTELGDILLHVTE